MKAIATVGEIAPGRTKKFLLDCPMGELEGFILNVGGEHHAFLNRCRHVPMSLDWVENQFFTAEGDYIQCATHGALYRPETGECMGGPPCGKSLHRIPLTIDAGTIYAACPAHLPDD